MVNCLNFQKTTTWYQAFGRWLSLRQAVSLYLKLIHFLGMKHDPGVDFRSEEVAFSQGKEYFMGQMKAFTHHENMWTDCHFLRGTRDPSHMHLELLEYNDSGGTIADPPCVGRGT
jgi:hypothetical protein